MERKMALMVVLAFLFSTVLATQSITPVRAEETPPTEDPLWWYVNAVGTYFEITNSEYLNITITSSETVHVILESVPKTVNFVIESNSSATSTLLTFSGFEPNALYYRYQDGNLMDEFATDSTGAFTYTQDISEAHNIFIQEETTTLHIWSNYTFTHDIYETIIVEANNIVIDGNGYMLQGPGWGSGFYLSGRSNVTIKNVIIKEWRTGVDLVKSGNNLITGNTISNSDTAIQLWYKSGNNLITGNTISYSGSQWPFLGILALYECSNNVISGNTISNSGLAIFAELYSKNNVITGNTISNNFVGIWLSFSCNNHIVYRNNIIENSIFQAMDMDGDNDWHHPVLLEGNYWSDYPGVDDGSGTGKHAIAGDGIGDTDMPWPGPNYDYYPLTHPITYTPTGAEVIVTDPNTGITLQFDEVTGSGVMRVTTSDTGPAPPTGFKIAGLYYDITTTASYTGTITIGIPYDETQVTGKEENLRLKQWDPESAGWNDTTTWVDTINNIIYGEVTSLSIFAVMELEDVTPPTTDLTIGTHYVDETGKIYVTSATEFTLTATDDVSGVAHTHYRINNGDWIEYVSNFKLIGPDGPYTIDYYSVDVAGNEETPKSATAILVSLKVNSYLTDSDFNPITNFDMIFVKDNSGGYKLVSTNPGQFYYNIDVMNDWPIAVDTLTIDTNIPADFALKGAVPIHVYLDGTDTTDLCTIDGTTITMTNIPAESMVYITIHVDYVLKGTVYTSLDEFEMKDYTFDTTVSGSASASGGNLIGTHTSSATLIAHQKKTTAIAGFVTDADGNSIVDATIELFDSNGNLIATTVTDENGLYYFIDIPAEDYTIQVTYNSQVYIQTATAVSKELTQVDFKIE